MVGKVPRAGIRKMIGGKKYIFTVALSCFNTIIKSSYVF
jgi:hypothetical protein